MIITRTPFRISFLGGGTDYPQWYENHGGRVIGATINKYCYLTVRSLPPFFEHKHRIVYSRVELPSHIAEIQHPAVRAVMSELNIQQGIEIHHHADLPARSGLGSSSAFTVGLLNSLYNLQGKIVSADYLAQEAIRIEQEVIAENVGSQDQMWAAHGGINVIEFRGQKKISLTPVVMNQKKIEQLNQHILMVFTGLTRNASDIAGKKMAILQQREQQLYRFMDMVDIAQQILQSSSSNIRDFGELLDEAWQIKRQLVTGVTNTTIDDIYAKAKTAGAIGGKLLGAGSGGFLMLFVPPELKKKVVTCLHPLITVDVTLGSCGSKVVMYEPNGLENV